jgi:hypothetical protein
MKPSIVAVNFVQFVLGDSKIGRFNSIPHCLEADVLGCQQQAWHVLQLAKSAQLPRFHIWPGPPSLGG